MEKMEREIGLNIYDLITSGQTGLLRAVESIKKQKGKWGHGYKGEFTQQINDSIFGTMGELAVAKFLDVPYKYHCNAWNDPDLVYKNYNIQVRTQYNRDNYFLIIRPKAKPNELYIHVYIPLKSFKPIFKISGFINSSDILKTEKYLTYAGHYDRDPFHKVPINILKSIDLLKPPEESKKI